MVVQSTFNEFEAFTAENPDKRYEFIDGEIYEVPSNPYVSEIANLISFFIRLFLVKNGLKGHVTGADSGFMVNGDTYAPDVAYISYERQPELAQKGFNPNPPDLAVEVISDPNNSQEQSTLRRKIVNYLAAGTVVWVVDAFEKTIEVYDGIDKPAVYTINDEIPGGELLPNFTLKLTDIFPSK